MGIPILVAGYRKLPLLRRVNRGGFKTCPRNYFTFVTSMKKAEIHFDMFPSPNNLGIKLLGTIQTRLHFSRM